jgi:hypothetical protein
VFHDCASTKMATKKINDVQIWCVLAMMRHLLTRGVIYQSDQCDSSTRKQIRKHTKEHLGTFFSDGVFCKFFVIFLAPEPPEYANVQIRRWPFPPYLPVK